VPAAPWEERLARRPFPATLALVIAVAGACPLNWGCSTDRAQQEHSQHTVTVTFDYDFRQTPACTAKVTRDCVASFRVYDISNGRKRRHQLFDVPLPQSAKGLVKGISGTSPKLDFEQGKHLLEVKALTPDGAESGPPFATTWITVP